MRVYILRFSFGNDEFLWIFLKGIELLLHSVGWPRSIGTKGRTIGGCTLTHSNARNYRTGRTNRKFVLTQGKQHNENVTQVK